jgi:hypothetical protein
MFKPGEIAKVRSDGRLVTILPIEPEEASRVVEFKWPVKTSEGVFDETELFPAHPTVTITTEARAKSKEEFLDEVLGPRDKGTWMSYELLSKIQLLMDRASFDIRGHWKNGSLLDEKIRPDYLFVSSMHKADAEDLLRAVGGGVLDQPTPHHRRKRTQKKWMKRHQAKCKAFVPTVALDRWVPVASYILGTRKCYLCGQRDFGLETNGLELRIAGEPCAYPEGLPLTEWELNVPSGRLAVANDLRLIFPLPEGDDDYDINTTFGCRQTALAYAANGLSHAYVGNSSPGVFRCKDGTYKIATPPATEYWDDEAETEIPIDPVPEFDGEELVRICTDLRWYSICDADEYQRRLDHFQEDPGKFRGGEPEFIDVKPGVYRFRHDEEARRYDGPEEQVLSRFEWVREPDPVKDFLGDFKAIEVNPHAFVQAQVARWPTLYGKTKHVVGRDVITPWAQMTEEERLSSWRRVADHIFCVLGGGTEWHENGFPLCKVDPTIPDIEPPAFRAQEHWYPFSERYGGLFEKVTLAPGFAKVAFRVLESVISFGMTVHDGARSREVRGTRERMLTAVKRYRVLAKKYPGQADPEYVAWLSQEGRAEAWVETFDLGPEFTDKHREHARRQRWIHEDTYAVAFDARKLKDGRFAWHPKMPSVGGCNARKEDAQRYALTVHKDNGQPGVHNCFWAGACSVPLFSVARIVRVGEVSYMGETLVEVAYDYGTIDMQNVSVRKAVREHVEKDGIQVLTREGYEALLPKAIEFYEEAERKIEEIRRQRV